MSSSGEKGEKRDKRDSRGPSMRALALLKPPRELEKLVKAIALLDAILEPEWDYRYYSYNELWDDSLGQRLASMRNGSGDEWQLVFAREGAFLKGFAHESPMAGLRLPAAKFIEGLPPALAPFAIEPAFMMDTTTFCAWCTDGQTWLRARSLELPPGKDPDGSEWLLSILDGDPATYQRYAREYFEEEVPLDAIKAIYQGRPLTRELVHRIDRDRELDDLGDDLDEIGWPKGDTN